MNYTIILALMGGLGLFLYGMKLMSDGLEKAAGAKLRRILEIFTTNRLTGMLVGIFRSGGDTKFGLIMDVSTMWGCSILLGALAAFVLHWSVPAVYVLLMSDELIKVPITLIRYRSFKWLKDVTRDNV